MSKQEYSVKKVSSADRLHLSAWLAEWQIDQDLGESDVDDAAALIPSHAAYQKPSAEIGDIWLAGPIAGEVRPLYMLVVAAIDDTLVWVPFSPFSTPALPGEWKTGLRAMPLRVLCFWNARAADGRSAVCKGWKVKRLTAAQLSGAQSVWNWVKGQGNLSPAIRKRIGPPLVHPADPRHRYREQEWERMESHFKRASLEESEDELSGPYLAESGAAPGSHLLAAETRGAYGIHHMVYQSADGRIVFFCSIKNQDIAQIRVTDEKGYPCEAAEGGCLVTDEGQSSSPIRNGTAFAPRSCVDRWSSFKHADGSRVPVHSAKK